MAQSLIFSKPNGTTDSSGCEPQSPPNNALSYTNAMVFATVKFVITNREFGRLAEVIALQGVKSALMKATNWSLSWLAGQTREGRVELSKRRELRDSESFCTLGPSGEGVVHQNAAGEGEIHAC